MRLTALKKGEQGVILNFDELSDSFSRRLYDVGIAVGSEVTVLNILNFGHLFYLSIDGIDFCMRATDAKKVSIERIG